MQLWLLVVASSQLDPKEVVRTEMNLPTLFQKNRANLALGTIFVCNLMKNLDISEK